MDSPPNPMESPGIPPDVCSVDALRAVFHETHPCAHLHAAPGTYIGRYHVDFYCEPVPVATWQALWSRCVARWPGLLCEHVAWRFRDGTLHVVSATLVASTLVINA